MIDKKGPHPTSQITHLACLLHDILPYDIHKLIPFEDETDDEQKTVIRSRYLNTEYQSHCRLRLEMFIN